MTTVFWRSDNKRGNTARFLGTPQGATRFLGDVSPSCDQAIRLARATLATVLVVPDWVLFCGAIDLIYVRVLYACIVLVQWVELTCSFLSVQ